MTKKHFEAMAEAVKARIEEAEALGRTAKTETQGGYSLGMKHASRQIAYDLATVAQASNPNFDRSRFLRACGV